MSECDCPALLDCDCAERQDTRAARRFEAAKAALMGLLAYSPAAGGVQVTPQTAALVAVEYADALLAALDGTEDK